MSLYPLISILPKYPPLLLDTYTSASIAYSLRKLRSYYTGFCIRVRRSSDNSEQNIGFIGNDLDTASLLSFVGAGDAFVTIWYDQSGNANHASQTTALSQPQIVSSGIVNTLLSGKPCVVNSSSLRMNMTNSITTTTNLTMYSVYEGRVPGLFSNFMDNSSSAYLYGIGATGNYLTSHGVGATFTFQTITAVNNRILSLFRNSANLMTSFQQKTQLTNTTTRTGNTTYVRILGAGKFSEIIFWNGQNLISQQGDISDKINEYYGIY